MPGERQTGPDAENKVCPGCGADWACMAERDEAREQRDYWRRIAETVAPAAENGETA